LAWRHQHIHVPKSSQTPDRAWDLASESIVGELNVSDEYRDRYQSEMATVTIWETHPGTVSAEDANEQQRDTSTCRGQDRTTAASGNHATCDGSGDFKVELYGTVITSQLRTRVQSGR
jgi:hypothetical protein